MYPYPSENMLEVNHNYFLGRTLKYRKEICVNYHLGFLATIRLFTCSFPVYLCFLCYEITFIFARPFECLLVLHQTHNKIDGFIFIGQVTRCNRKVAGSIPKCDNFFVGRNWNHLSLQQNHLSLHQNHLSLHQNHLSLHQNKILQDL